MTRVLSSACVLLLVLGLGGSARAGSKPAIAILGLEVYDNGGGIDPETTRAAKELTMALRDRAKAGTGPYLPVQGGEKAGEKELIDEKLLNNCDTEATTCMATIGNELGAEMLLYGRIWLEKPAQAAQGTYKVSLKLLNVKGKQLASSTVETLPLAESTGVRLTAHAKTWYAKLVGATSGGTLAIRVNIDRATVLVDDEAKGSLTSGSLTLSGIPEGRHTLAIEAKDYQRYETQITVRTGETTTQNVTLVEPPRSAAQAREAPGEPMTREGTVSAKRSNVWKPVFYGTAAATAASIGFTVYAWRKEVSAADDVTSKLVSDKNCGSDTGLTGNERTSFQSACDWRKRNVVGWVVSSVLGAATVGSFVMAYLRNSGPEDDAKTAARGHHKRRELVVTPVVTPGGGGATLQFDW